MVMRAHLLLSMLGLLSSVIRGESSLLAAVAAAPDLRARRLQVEAARAREEAAGRLPDPEVEAMASRVDMPEGVNPMVELQFRQPLPRRGERAAERAMAAAELRMAEAEWAMAVGERAADIARALAEAAAAEERREVFAGHRDHLRRALAVVDTRVATGGGRAVERLALLSRLAEMDLMIAQEERMAADLRAEIRAGLGSTENAPGPAFSAPEVERLVAQHAPATQRAQARAGLAEARERMAQASARPMTALALRWEREQASEADIDTAGVAFMSELPLRAPGRARAEMAAAAAERRAALQEAQAVVPRLEAALGNLRRAEQWQAEVRRLVAETRQRLVAETDTLLGAAGTTGEARETPLLVLLELLERRHAIDVQWIEAETEVRRARAALWRWVDVTPLLNPAGESP
jgi:outer membrane protein TolC